MSDSAFAFVCGERKQEGNGNFSPSGFSGDEGWFMGEFWVTCLPIRASNYIIWHGMSECYLGLVSEEKLVPKGSWSSLCIKPMCKLFGFVWFLQLKGKLILWIHLKQLVEDSATSDSFTYLNQLRRKHVALCWTRIPRWQFLTLRRQVLLLLLFHTKHIVCEDSVLTYDFFVALLVF